MAVVVIPALYALARLTTFPLSVVLSLVLHWCLACSILAATSDDRSEVPDIGLRRRLPRFVCFVLVIVAWCSGLIWYFGAKPLASWQVSQMHQLGRWGVILIAISAGFCEEVIYRGYMLAGLKKTEHPVWLAMILSSLSFVFFHGILPVPFMTGGFLIAMIWAFIAHKSSVLWVTIYIHALWDATVLLVPWGPENQ